MDAEDDGGEDVAEASEGKELKDSDAAADSEPNNEIDNNGVPGENRQPKEESDNSIGSDEEVEGKGKADDEERLLFQLTVVNSYGSQEVQKLEGSKRYKFSSQCIF